MVPVSEGFLVIYPGKPHRRIYGVGKKAFAAPESYPPPQANILWEEPLTRVASGNPQAFKPSQTPPKPVPLAAKT